MKITRLIKPPLDVKVTVHYPLACTASHGNFARGLAEIPATGSWAIGYQGQARRDG